MKIYTSKTLESLFSNAPKNLHSQKSLMFSIEAVQFSFSNTHPCLISYTRSGDFTRSSKLVVEICSRKPKSGLHQIAEPSGVDWQPQVEIVFGYNSRAILHQDRFCFLKSSFPYEVQFVPLRSFKKTSYLVNQEVLQDEDD